MGFYSHWVDSVSMDDYGGGVMAGQLLLSRIGCGVVCVVGGPKGDLRSIARVDGFRSIYPKSQCFYAGSWGRPMPRRLFQELSQFSLDGAFCVSDRIASRVLKETRWSGEVPHLVGFDNTPAALESELTTIAIPWGDLVDSACAVILQRLNQDRSAARDAILRPQVVMRDR